MESIKRKILYSLTHSLHYSLILSLNTRYHLGSGDFVVILLDFKPFINIPNIYCLLSARHWFSKTEVVEMQKNNTGC